MNFVPKEVATESAARIKLLLERWGTFISFECFKWSQIDLERVCSHSTEYFSTAKSERTLNGFLSTTVRANEFSLLSALKLEWEYDLKILACPVFDFLQSDYSPRWKLNERFRAETCTENHDIFSNGDLIMCI